MTSLHITCSLVAATLTLVGCDLLKPQDEPAANGTFVYVLDPHAAIPSVADDASLASQIQIGCGISSTVLSSGVVPRLTAKALIPGSNPATGGPVRYWNFGAAPLALTSAVSASLYLLVEADGVTPRGDHPWLLDSIPGDPGYSPIRRIIRVPVTADYHGERLTSVAALNEAIERGLVAEPVSAETWRNVPVVPQSLKIEVGASTSVGTTEVYADGYRVGAFVFGGAFGVQPLTGGKIPMGQYTRLLSGVADANGVLTTVPDPQPILQYGVPAAAPILPPNQAAAFNYTPYLTALDVRLANAVAPSAIARDGELFTRSATGGMTGFLATTVASFTITTTFSNLQLQFQDGAL